ncbi:ribonuclease H-like domain-containing protein [Tanacetum coccineum]
MFDFGLHLYASTTGFLVAYSDVEWAGNPTTRRSTSCYSVFSGDDILSWLSKRQYTLSRSSLEAGYRGVANVVAETVWLCQVRVLHVASCYQYADIFTKRLPSALSEEFRISLSIRSLT